jgi:hypothetical protein
VNHHKKEPYPEDFKNPNPYHEVKSVVIHIYLLALH